MSFWNSDNEEARRREEERQRRLTEERERKSAEAKRQAKVVKAQRQAALAIKKERRRIRAEQDAEDKKLRDALVEKMLQGGKEKNSETSMPRLNRGLGGDRATPTSYQQCFQHLKKPGEAGAAPPSRAEADDDKSSSGGGAAERSFPPLKRPF